jgi:radical SAM protein with 4Fe4S-binding SPASM domain
MYRYATPYPDTDRESLPRLCRPIIRFRPEAFGYLAAFPSGKIALYDATVRSLLESGATYDQCRPHLLTRLNLPTDFHFNAPLMAWIEITRRCNLRCAHCFVEGGQRRSSEMSTDRILALLEEWAEMGVFSVVITGGEPTIHPDFVEIVQRAYNLGFTVGIATNGTTLTPKLLEKIPHDDVIISISLDEAHDQGGATGLSDFDYVTRRLLEVRDQGFNTSVMTTTTHDNVHVLERVVNWAVENDISLRSVPFVPMGRGALYRMMLNKTADVEHAARFWLAEEAWERVRDQKLGLCTGKVFNFLMTMAFSARRCMSGRGNCYVDSSGDVYPCTTCSGARVLSGGNVLFESFAELWNSDRWAIRDITWKNFENTCKGCPINEDKYFCTGRCPGSSAVHHGTLTDCGMTDFLRQSVLRREELFRDNIRPEPRVEMTQVTVDED